jgi:hypothetical protein
VTSEFLNDWGIEHSHQFGSHRLDLRPLGTKAVGQVLGDPPGRRRIRTCPRPHPALVIAGPMMPWQASSESRRECFAPVCRRLGR